MTYAREEFAERARRVFATGKAQVGSVKCAITALAKATGMNWHRARDLIRMKREPRVEEMDLIRELDGDWCRETRKPKADIMQRMHDRLESLGDRWEAFEGKVEAFMERRRAKREKAKSISREPIMDRLYSHGDRV